jgi:hypothetical protein
MANTYLLDRINVPNITDASYMEGLADAFKKINSNFEKLASTPFLQGVKGDSYELVTENIFESSGETYVLTDWGVKLLNSIFEVSLIEGNTIGRAKEAIGRMLSNGVSPIDSFTDTSGNIINNDLYFYAIKNDDDTHSEYMLGQYYYFIDARISSIASEIAEKDSSAVLNSFEDYTGIYSYNNKTDKFEKLNIVPSLYYDSSKNDFCWKFGTQKSGITAIGPSGTAGVSANFYIVYCKETQKSDYEYYTSTAESILTENGWKKIDSVISTTDNNICIAYIKDIANITSDKYNTPKFVYGIIKKITGDEATFKVTWTCNTVIDDAITQTSFNTYLKNIGSTLSPYITIPFSTGSDKYHCIKGIKKSNDTSYLTVAARKEDEETGKYSYLGTENELILDKYNVTIGNWNDVDTDIASAGDVNQVKIGYKTGIAVYGSSSNATITNIKNDKISTKNVTLGNCEFTSDFTGYNNSNPPVGIFTGELYAYGKQLQYKSDYKNEPQSGEPSNPNNFMYTNNPLALSMPVGSIIMYGGIITGAPKSGKATKINDSWLLCDGSQFSATEYPLLCNVLGSNILPDMQNRYPMGAGPQKTASYTIKKNKTAKSIYNETGINADTTPNGIYSTIGEKTNNKILTAASELYRHRRTEFDTLTTFVNNSVSGSISISDGKDSTMLSIKNELQNLETSSNSSSSRLKSGFTYAEAISWGNIKDTYNYASLSSSGRSGSSSSSSSSSYNPINIKVQRGEYGGNDFNIYNKANKEVYTSSYTTDVNDTLFGYTVTSKPTYSSVPCSDYSYYGVYFIIKAR